MPGAAWFHKTITPGWWSVIWHIFKNKWDKIFQLQTNLTSFYPEPSVCLNCSATNYPRSRELPRRITKWCLLREINCWSDSRIKSSWRKRSELIHSRWDTDVLFFVFRRAFCAVFTRIFFGSCFLRICVCLLHNKCFNKKKWSNLQEQFHGGWKNFWSVELWQLMPVFSTSERFN